MAKIVFISRIGCHYPHLNLDLDLDLGIMQRPCLLQTVDCKLTLALSRC